MKTMKIKEAQLNNTQYIAEKCKKKQIILHHTVSASADPAMNWWKSTKERVATAFIIDKDGMIFKLFEPEYWAYQIGKGSTIVHNKQSIGIELVNEGYLIKRDGEYFWFNGVFKYKDKDNVVIKGWRDRMYWPKYTDAQMESLAMLLNYLCEKYGIKKELYCGLDYDAALLEYEGIISHCNVRRDKTDISPAFDFEELRRRILNFPS